jgi:hypothetical protein
MGPGRKSAVGYSNHENALAARSFASLRISAAGSPLRLRSGSRPLVASSCQRASQNGIVAAAMAACGNGHTSVCSDPIIIIAHGGLEVCDGAHRLFVMKKPVPGAQCSDGNWVDDSASQNLGNRRFLDFQENPKLYAAVESQVSKSARAGAPGTGTLQESRATP